jgi:hypothetical protein
VSRSFLGEGRRVVLRLFGVLGTRAVIVICLLVSASVAMGAWRNLWMGARGTAVAGIVVRQDVTLSVDPGDADSAAGASGPSTVSARRLFQAVVEFNVGDRVHHVRAREAAPVHLYPLGSTQVVVFMPDRPADARLMNELPDMWTQALLLLMATVIGAGAVKWWWWLAKRRPRFRRRPKPPAEHPEPPAATISA